MTNDVDRLSDLEAFWAGKEVQLYTTMPGEVLEYDADKRRASVVLGIQMGVRGDDGTLTTKDRPIIHHAPVVFPAGGGASMSWPLEKGDKVMVHFSMRCMDDWLDTGRRLPPRFPWKHDINDAIVVPGLTPFNEVQPGATGAIEIEFGDGLVSVAGGAVEVTSGGRSLKIDGGSISIGSSTVDLLDLVNDLASAVETLSGSLVTLSTGVTAPLSNAADVKTSITAIKASLSTIS